MQLYTLPHNYLTPQLPYQTSPQPSCSLTHYCRVTIPYHTYQNRVMSMSENSIFGRTGPRDTGSSDLSIYLPIYLSTLFFSWQRFAAKKKKRYLGLGTRTTYLYIYPFIKNKNKIKRTANKTRSLCTRGMWSCYLGEICRVHR